MLPTVLQGTVSRRGHPAARWMAAAGVGLLATAIFGLVLFFAPAGQRGATLTAPSGRTVRVAGQQRFEADGVERLVVAVFPPGGDLDEGAAARDALEAVAADPRNARVESIAVVIQDRFGPLFRGTGHVFVREPGGGWHRAGATEVRRHLQGTGGR